MNEPDKSYGWMVLDSLFEELKLHDFMKKVKIKSNYDLTTALKLLVFQRILNPNSKLATVESQVDLFGDWDINLNAIYRYLDKLDEIKNDIQLHLHQEISRLTNQKRVVFSHYSQRKDRNGFVRNFKIYECEDCTGCPLREKCTKAKEGKNRRLNINPTWEYLKIKANEKIESKKTVSYYAQRKIDVETVFGNIKQNMKFKRFHVRGAEEIFKEVGLVFLANNFRKLVTRVRKYEGKTIIQNQI